MKKFKKIISIGLTAMMVLSVMCVGVSAAEVGTDLSLPYSVEKTEDSTVVTIELKPGEYIVSPDYDLCALTEDREWILKECTGTLEERTFNCYAEDGNSLNVWVQNVGVANVKATFIMPSSNSVVQVAPGDGGYTFNVTKTDGISGTYKLRVVDSRGSGYNMHIWTKARQFWD